MFSWTGSSGSFSYLAGRDPGRSSGSLTNLLACFLYVAKKLGSEQAWPQSQHVKRKIMRSLSHFCGVKASGEQTSLSMGRCVFKEGKDHSSTSDTSCHSCPDCALKPLTPRVTPETSVVHDLVWSGHL